MIRNGLCTSENRSAGGVRQQGALRRESFAPAYRLATQEEQRTVADVLAALYGPTVLPCPRRLCMPEAVPIHSAAPWLRMQNSVDPRSHKIV